MKPRSIAWLIAAFLLSMAALLTACDSRAAAVRATDESYDVALDSNDGATAVTFLSKDSLAWLDRMVELARTAKKSKVKNLPYGERHEVLQIRLLLKPGELRNIDGRSYYIRLVGAGWTGSTSEARRTKISLSSAGDAATVTYRYPGEQETFFGYWVFEDGAWKEDQVKAAFEASRSSDSDARAAGMTEDQMLVDYLEQSSGLEVPESIWDPG